jgi:hypothetical protein
MARSNLKDGIVPSICLLTHVRAVEMVFLASLEPELFTVVRVLGTYP